MLHWIELMRRGERVCCLFTQSIASKVQESLLESTSGGKSAGNGPLGPMHQTRLSARS